MAAIRSLKPSVTAANIVTGRTVLLSPHIDDEVLGCGGLIAQTPDPTRIEVLYATDGAGAFNRLMPRGANIDVDLVAIRQSEARCALDTLGVPPANLHFMNLPDGSLTRQQDRLTADLNARLKSMQPAVMLVPFRYDRHPDHIALHQAAVRAAQGLGIRIYEYFVYHYWRELPERDVRFYLDANRLHVLGIDGVADQKRRALACNVSQLTTFFDWQRYPVVGAALVESSLNQPEVFHEYDPQKPGLGAVVRSRPLVAGVVLSQRVFPALKRAKDALLR